MKPLAAVTCALLVLGLVVLYACRDTSELTEPSVALATASAATLGKWEPVLVYPFAATSGTSPSGICQRMEPEFRS